MEVRSGRFKKNFIKLLGRNFRRNNCPNYCMYRIIIGLVLVGMGIWAGNYFQHNKDKVKTNLKKFIDKL